MQGLSVAIRLFENTVPTIDPTAFIDETALVIGAVTIGADASLWPNVVARGDVNTITVGERTNIQDGSILHVNHDSEYDPGGSIVTVGSDVTVGHRAILHGCTVEDGCLVGMAATIMDGAVLRSGVLLAAGSLVTPNQELEGGYLWVGAPAKRVRPLKDSEREFLKYSPAHYVELKNRHIATVLK